MCVIHPLFHVIQVWNETLENLAQRWAMECKFEHGQPEEVKPAIGQNLWVGTGGYLPTSCDV